MKKYQSETAIDTSILSALNNDILLNSFRQQLVTLNSTAIPVKIEQKNGIVHYVYSEEFNQTIKMLQEQISARESVIMTNLLYLRKICSEISCL